MPDRKSSSVRSGNEAREHFRNCFSARIDDALQGISVRLDVATCCEPRTARAPGGPRTVPGSQRQRDKGTFSKLFSARMDDACKEFLRNLNMATCCEPRTARAPADREPSPVRSGNEARDPFELFSARIDDALQGISVRLDVATCCEPRTARAPADLSMRPWPRHLPSIASRQVVKNLPWPIHPRLCPDA